MKSLSALLFALFCTAPLFGGELLIPALYRGPGAAGTEWHTELMIADIDFFLNFPIHTVVTFYPTGGGEAEEVEVLLDSMKPQIVHDVLSEWFGVTEGGGIVRVTWTDRSAQITARARIYDVHSDAQSTGHGEGQFSQDVPGLPLEALHLENIFPGISGADGNRINVGISNPHSSPVQFIFELFDSTGQSRVAFFSVVEPRSYLQFNDVFSYYQLEPSDAATVRVRAIEQPLYPYVSVVRADTGNASFLTGVNVRAFPSPQISNRQ